MSTESVGQADDFSIDVGDLREIDKVLGTDGLAHRSLLGPTIDTDGSNAHRLGIHDSHVSHPAAGAYEGHPVSRTEAGFLDGAVDGRAAAHDWCGDVVGHCVGDLDDVAGLAEDVLLIAAGHVKAGLLACGAVHLAIGGAHDAGVAGGPEGLDAGSVTDLEIEGFWDVGADGDDAPDAFMAWGAYAGVRHLANGEVLCRQRQRYEGRQEVPLSFVRSFVRRRRLAKDMLTLLSSTYLQHVVQV